MAIRSPQQYIESLKDGRVVYLNGKRIENVTTDPILKVCRNWVAMDYGLSNNPDFQDLLIDVDENGERVSFALIPQRSKADLLRLREVVKLWARVCFGKPPRAKFVAKDGMNAVTVVSRRIDEKHGTN
jgi:aromatic ring hydroxylase